MVGPEFAAVRAFCGRVRGLITDMGVERLIADSQDILGDFFSSILGIPVPEQPLRWLFPRALQMPGWKHSWDLVIRRGLWMLPGFPLFLKGLKAVLKLLRNKTSELTKASRDAGYLALSSMIETGTCPAFADWRWSKMATCLRSLVGLIGSFARFF